MHFDLQEAMFTQHTTMKSEKTEKLQLALIEKAKNFYSTVKSSDSKGLLSKFISFPLMSRWITIDSLHLVSLC
jgi:hypothetical protein